jgi:hypothetical protein
MTERFLTKNPRLLRKMERGGPGPCGLGDRFDLNSEVANPQNEIYKDLRAFRSRIATDGIGGYCGAPTPRYLRAHAGGQRMATPTGTKVDAERARLRTEGYTETEIGLILVNQASGAARASENTTGRLENASVVLSPAKDDAKSGNNATESVNVHENRLDQRALKFVKEWGGVATVLIAILYTFPFDLIGKIVEWRERSVVAARAALSQEEELVANRILALKQVKDDGDFSETQFLSGSFDMRMFNTMITNRKTFVNAIEQLTPS